MLKRFSKRYRIVVYSIRTTKCILATDAFNRIELSDLPPIIRNFIGLLSNESIGTIQENEINLLQNNLEECNWNKKWWPVASGSGALRCIINLKNIRSKSPLFNNRKN
jgi:hypothetical protein